MSSGLYNTHKVDFDTTLDLTRLKPCVFFFFGTKPVGVDKVPPVHNCRFNIPDESFEAPLKLMISFVLDHMEGFEL